jgi:hypothetical protein
MVLGGPQHIETEFVHQPRNVAGCEKRLAQAFVGIAPLIRRGAIQTDIFKFDLANV